MPLEADRDVAEPDGAVAGVEQRPRDDPDRVREVDDPGAVGARARAPRSAISSTTGTVRSALAKPPAPVVSWPMQPHASGTVSSESRAGLSADADLDEHEVGPVERAVEIVGQLRAPREPAALEHPPGEPADDLAAAPRRCRAARARRRRALASRASPDTSSGV